MQHRHGSTPVFVESGSSAGVADLIRELVPEHRAVVITDANVSAALPHLLHGLPRLTFPAGESSKTVAEWSDLTYRLLAGNVDRRTVIVALGGGVTTDLAGFVAATLLRGVPWIAVPTTTLAMVDAAIGGKTGVDTAAGKNLIGAFHHPAAVVVDPQLLETLPDADYRDGLAEVVKHAAIADADAWAGLESDAAAILDRDTAVLTPVLTASAAIKAKVVSEDSLETGRRAVLNAGHTVAHAIEHATAYRIRHGAAVAIGLVAETRVAESLGIASIGATDRIIALLSHLQLPTAASDQLDLARFRQALLVDKKNREGQVHCALLAAIGRVATTESGDWTWPVSAESLVAAVT